MHADIFVPDATWLKISDWIADRPEVCAALKIGINPITCYPGFDEIIDVLGGMLGIWPERFRAVFAADPHLVERGNHELEWQVVK